MLVHIVIDIPFMSACNAAFVAPDEAHTVEELIEIEFQRLRSVGVPDPEIHVIGKVVILRHQGVTGIWQALGRKRTDQVVIPKGIAIGLASAKVHGGSLTTQGRRSYSLRHAKGDVVARGR